MSSIGNSLSSSAAQFLSLLEGPSSTSAQSSANTASSSSPDSTSEISQFGQLLNQLQKLSTSDPAKFKTLTAQIASQLKTAAGNATGSEAQFLTDLSGKFTQASKDGNISALEPQQSTQGSGGHHHHHHGGGVSEKAYSSTADTSTGTQNVLQTIFNEVQSA